MNTPDPKALLVRLEVDLALSTAAALTKSAGRRKISYTEAIRRAIAVLDLVETAQFDEGARVMVVTGHGDDAIYREVVMM